MKKVVLIFMISAVILAGCGAPAATKVATQVEQVPTEPPPAPTEPPAPTPTEVPVPTVTLPPILAAALPYPEALKVTTEKDIPYTKPLQSGVIEQKVDIYHPDGNGPWPVVMIIPPVGNYRNTLTAMTLGKKLAGQGMVVFILDAGAEEDTFMLAVAAEDNGKQLRQVLEEISCGLLFAQSNAQEYGGKPDNLILLGYGIGSLYGLNVALQGAQLESNWEAFAAKRGGPPAQTQCLAEGEPVKADAFVTYSGDFVMDELKEVDPELVGLVDPVANSGGNPDMKITLMYNLKKIYDDPPEHTTQFKDALTAAGRQVELFLVDAPSISISSRGPELDWITNAILQYAE